MKLSPRVLIALASIAACAPDPGRGRMDTLAPILGAGAMSRVPTTASSEPVEDYWTDLGDLLLAWPSVSYELPQLIQAVIARGTWVDEHHTAMNFGSGLHVRHRPEVVREAKKLVRNLRAMILRPIDIEVAFVELPENTSLGPWDMKAFRALVAKKEAKELGRITLSPYGGQWALGERMTNQAVLSGVAVENGGVTPRTVTLASGITVQAAAWRWGEDRAVVALTGLVTGEVPGGATIAQEVHRALPQRAKNQTEWEPHQVKLALPMRSLFEVQVQVAVVRRQWTAVAVMPMSPGRICAALVRIDWTSAPPAIEQVDPLSNAGYVLESIPIALPTETRAAIATDLEFNNRRSIDENAAGWLKQRAQSSAESQKRAIYNFQAESGSLNIDVATKSAQGIRRKGGPAAPAEGPSVPEVLEAMSAEIMNSEWPTGTALEFVANHVFVVHAPPLTQKLRTLLERTHDWSNRVVTVDVSFVSVAAGDTAAPLLPRAHLLARPGAWTDAFAGYMHAVLAGAWPADRSSPPVQVFWSGTRLALRQPESSGRMGETDLLFRRYTVDRLAPEWIAKAAVQFPQDSVWSLDRRLHLIAGQPLMTGLAGDSNEPYALIVRRDETALR